LWSPGDAPTHIWKGERRSPQQSPRFMIHTSRTACWPEIRIDNHGLASSLVWQKSEDWSLMQSAAGLDQRGWVELMLALRRGIAGMLGLWHSTLAILSKLRRIAKQTLHRAHPGCDLPRRLPRAPCVPSRIVLDRSALNSPTNRATRPAIAKKTIESRQANRPISPWRAEAFHPVAAELACV